MSTVALGAWRARFELIQYVRSGDTLVFTFLFPIALLALFSTIFGADGDFTAGPGLPAIPVAQMYLPAMLAAGIATERTNGMLKRLGATPLSPVSYFLGKIGQVGVTAVVQAGLIILFAVVVFQVPLPTEPEKWLTFTWVFVLGVVTSALLGVALSAVPRSGRSASAVIIPIVLVVQFISGVYLFFFLLPDWLQTAASVLPVKWMAQGMREVFLPAEYAVLEQGGEWNLGGVAVALGVWLIVGLVLARLTFRWNRRDA